MKRSMLTMLLALTATSSALALGPTFAFGVHANFTSSNFPGPAVAGSTSQISNAYGAGLGGGVHADLNLMVVSFRLSADYIHYSIDQNKVRNAFGPLFANVTIDGGDLGITSISANGKMPLLPLPVISPYLTGGVGLAWLSLGQVNASAGGIRLGSIPSSTQAGKTSLDVGAGVDLKLGISLFLEVKYAWIFTEGSTSTYVPLSVGVTF